MVKHRASRRRVKGHDKLHRLNKKYGTKRVTLKKSRIRNAGISAFAAKPISEGVRLGEYKGRILNEEEVVDLPHSKQCYLFEVKRKSGGNVLIDAYPMRTSNWTRFVNSIKKRHQRKKENAKYYQYAQKIWIKTTRAVGEGEELICDYGSDYWTDDEDEGVDEEDTDSEESE